ncbi:hypothetical protein B0T25DRAFT_515047 [Lasiosphaeria hispida]|uniref:RNase T2-like C-terminal domain-containing protein n=1 Tax=Lasiosphaeria hispida TaxID=260671 RepID=A0AAJ0HQG4_9PEZI|nr:hypothetical protein B0T25DRAFT_515047 [Lasiosphaeria hispida]
MPSLPNLLVLSLSGLAAGATSFGSFSGLGEIHTVWNEGDHSDLGCLTSTGLWTADLTRCDLFEVNRHASDNTVLLNLTSAAGPCYITNNGRFKCGRKEDKPPGKALDFGVYDKTLGYPIPGLEVLRLGMYGLMASDGKNPPDVNDEPQELHFVSFIEKGKYVWLAWVEPEV